MKCDFRCKTNLRDPWINTAVFKTMKGDEVVIDRDATNWTVEEISEDEYILDMSWENCYVWDGEEQHYEYEYPPGELNFEEFDLEDDAPREDYYVIPLSYYVG